MRHKTGKLISVYLIFAAAFAAVVLAPSPLSAEGKRLEVTSERANVYIDPDSRSAVVETLERGAILTLASPMKMKINWFYVYYLSPRSGATRAGYVHDSLVRPLYPLVKSVNISSGDSADKGEINPESVDILNPAWGTTRESIIRTEGRPSEETGTNGLRILCYRRAIMNRNWQVEYVLGDGGLITTRYKLLDAYYDNARYIDDYNKLRVFLTSKVGEPRSDKVVWKKEGVSDLKSDPGAALGRGYVLYSSEWVFRDVSVRLKLDGAGTRVALAAEVQDVKAGHIE